jgi:hypothetical protein
MPPLQAGVLQQAHGIADAAARPPSRTCPRAVAGVRCATVEPLGTMTVDARNLCVRGAKGNLLFITVRPRIAAETRT